MISNSNSEVYFISGRDVFVALPSGYGKSLIYADFSQVFDLLFNKNDLLMFQSHSISIQTCSRVNFLL